MHATVTSEARLPDGRFAPGHSGNPAGRPKGSKGLGTRLVAALREGEDEIILRTVIEEALAGDKVAARFCASRIDAAARDGERGADLPPPPGIAPADALNPYYLHAKLVQAVIEGTLPAERALGILRVAAAKRQLSDYAGWELDNEEYTELGGTFRKVEEAEEEAATPSDPPPQAARGCTHLGAAD
jgi:hypothetical protein